jgi:DNA invertase Pin-like site-specific DNA recombinase
MQRVEAGQADGLFVTKLDRLARSFLDFASMLDRAQRKRWALVILDPNIDLSTPAGRMVAGILATVAEFERDLVSQRTREARAAAIAAGKPVGGRKAGSYEIPTDVRRRIMRERQEHRSFRAIARDSTRTASRPPAPARGQPRPCARSCSPRSPRPSRSPLPGSPLGAGEGFRP